MPAEQRLTFGFSEFQGVGVDAPQDSDLYYRLNIREAFYVGGLGAGAAAEVISAEELAAAQPDRCVAQLTAPGWCLSILWRVHVQIWDAALYPGVGASTAETSSLTFCAEQLRLLRHTSAMLQWSIVSIEPRPISRVQHLHLTSLPYTFDSGCGRRQRSWWSTGT